MQFSQLTVLIFSRRRRFWLVLQPVLLWGHAVVLAEASAEVGGVGEADVLGDGGDGGGGAGEQAGGFLQAEGREVVDDRGAGFTAVVAGQGRNAQAYLYGDVGQGDRLGEIVAQELFDQQGNGAMRTQRRVRRGGRPVGHGQQASEQQDEARGGAVAPAGCPGMRLQQQCFHLGQRVRRPARWRGGARAGMASW